MTRQVDRRRLRLHTLQRLAEWNEHGKPDAGPIVLLELGYRAASALIGNGER